MNRLRWCGLSVVALGFLACLTSVRSVLGQAAPAGEGLWKRLIQETYAKHEHGIRNALPPYSSMPAVLDLTGKQLQDGTCDQHIAWEDRFSGVMSIRPISDPGVPAPFEATSTSLTTTDGVCCIYAVPAKQSSLVVIARPTSSKVCVAKSLRYVYTRFLLEISEEYKHNKREPHGGQHVAAQFGASILFPSGQLTTFLVDNDGFVGLQKQYILFLWKPVRSDDTYVITQAYLIEDGLVFPVSTSAGNASRYTKVPFKDFESKVKMAVAKNIDID